MITMTKSYNKIKHQVKSNKYYLFWGAATIAVITVLLAAYGIYKGFFANKNLTDPWDDHDD